MIENPISRYICPYLIGTETAREIVGLMLFMDIRHDRFHLLLAGDPGSAKSNLMDFAVGVHSNAVKVTKHTSAAGLVGAADQRGNITGGVMRTMSGDGKLIGVDELDKCNIGVKNGLLEAMQERTVTLTKAGIRHEFPAIINLIASCNPKAGHWSGKPRLDAIPLPSPLLTRFNAIIPTIDLDKKYYGDVGESFYHRQQIDTSELEQKIIRGFTVPTELDAQQYRRAGEYVGALKASHGAFYKQITPRMVEGFVSVIEARAKFLGRPPQPTDFTYAYDLYKEILNEWMRD